MPSSRLIALLRSPDESSRLTDTDWNGILEEARKTQLLGQLAVALQCRQLQSRPPVAIQRHLSLAVFTATRRSQAALWEVAAIRRAVDPSVPLVLLKGCAYVACGDANAQGRSFSDIDLLVRHCEIPAVEADLTAAGWKPGRVNNYDNAYYRNWMHEIPPMEHVRRHTVIDLHHAINPPVSRYHIDTDRLLESAMEVSPGLFVLAEVDRVIHCALHLLQEGVPTKLMRDLYDLHVLLRQHQGNSPEIEALRQRAHSLNVLRLVDTAVGAARGMFADKTQPQGRSGWHQTCVGRAARDANGNTSITGELAAAALLAHSHWMKMPLPLLVPHLLRKSLLRVTLGKKMLIGPA